MSKSMEHDIPLLALTQEEAARAVGVSTVTMRKWILLSDFPAFKAGKRWIIPVDAFREWLNKNAAERKQIISDD